METLETRIHKTHFKNRLLTQLEDLSAHNNMKEAILFFNEYIPSKHSSW